jgi:hypothetical protein
MRVLYCDWMKGAMQYLAEASTRELDMKREVCPPVNRWGQYLRQYPMPNNMDLKEKALLMLIVQRGECSYQKVDILRAKFYAGDDL